MNQGNETTSVAQDGQAAFIGLAPLMRQAFSGVDLKPLGAALIERSERNPRDAHTLMDLSTVLQLTGNRDIALATQAHALEMQQIYRVPAATGTPGIRLLAIMAPGDLMANTPLEFLLEESDVTLDMLYLTPGMDSIPELPDHDVLFVAIGESDENRALLEQLTEVTRHWPRPVLNAPDRIANLSRDRACSLLQGAPGIEIPKSVRIPRETLEQIGRDALPIGEVIGDGSFPIIVRPVGSHAGHGLEKIDSPHDIAAYLQGMPHAEFYVARFVDYRGADGLFRKYRIILIEGRPYVSHMAISSHWMIHYLNAGMTDSAEKRAEEARFMAGFDDEFAPRHAQAFQAITERLGLDYVGLDCGETADGKLLIFEADSDMIVHAMDPVDMFPYKQPQMRKLFAAFRTMLGNAAMRSNEAI
ncbi:ATP-grasp domain-containing protein [Noviherbaspirillum denitrificans]|uniref:Glutathione synthase n=1 Tax=Noviherbaspirillum denitrificans TaxID=1968433 RepID=A0A254TE34_9BURK|nr:RimK family alpha-L-glutamate ligase [Noviherbaspirillum denitrificans]OWW20919.1 glutathione synthase [Noviherbaspirillum denitrificans]